MVPHALAEMYLLSYHTLRNPPLHLNSESLLLSSPTAASDHQKAQELGFLKLFALRCAATWVKRSEQKATASHC